MIILFLIIYFSVCRTRTLKPPQFANPSNTPFLAQKKFVLLLSRSPCISDFYILAAKTSTSTLQLLRVCARNLYFINSSADRASKTFFWFAHRFEMCEDREQAIAECQKYIWSIDILVCMTLANSWSEFKVIPKSNNAVTEARRRFHSFVHQILASYNRKLKLIILAQMLSLIIQQQTHR